MSDLNLILKTDDIMYILKIFFISIFTIYTNLKILNKKEYSRANIVKMCIAIFIINVFCLLIKNNTSSITSTICLDIFIAIIFSININNNLGYAILITTISLGINYILYSISITVSYLMLRFTNIKNDYIILLFIILIYGILLKLLFCIRKFKQGISFLKRNKDNEYFGLIVLNISIIIIFLIIILSNYRKEITGKLGVGLLIFSIMMFITIQKSLQLYYKQKLLIQDLNETKEELEKEKQEVEQLEKENLNFSKTSHSIAHKQKSLEYKLNELMAKSEIASEIDIKDRLNTISKELYSEKVAIELAKTDIPEIDDMLKYMQSECIKGKIDFQLQLSGNIHHMINKYVEKENLEILIADHIKNAIIAINYSDNINKSILVRLGMIDGNYSLYVYDSGIEFEIDTLLNLGKKPSTTHSDNGGTGMGFMNTFDTLKKYKASMIINEYGKPCKDNYTKLIMFKFDKKNEFKICSYRSEEIKEKDIKNSLNIEKISEGLQ